ncbi:hypothetical protein [Pseudobdellovibrio exovorus]|uniref:Uncharacterized protein n=1 Tax=Pseudobdellovibrio exovorus JSS TaxID=1184267 RepID=M4VE62_9BACT|nr:hypothetical protein [Pseudobdellovibrio exovorus]AGH96785.1 hypothetical protein A11Q_2569 [Pseudobdellovibrio exovorus JSS]
MFSIQKGRKALILSVIIAAQSQAAFAGELVFAVASPAGVTASGTVEASGTSDVSSQLASTQMEIEALREMLIERTVGNNELYNRVISPAKSLDKNQSESERTMQANENILNDVERVLTAFNSSSEADKLNAVLAAINQIDSNIIKNKGVNIQFTNGEPSAAVNRNFLMIYKSADKANLTAESLLNTLSSYRRSARPSDHAYEYSMVDNLQQSDIRYTRGNDDTWKPPQAPASIEIGTDMAIKKCRQILGWRCATALYSAGEVLSGEQNVKYFYTGSYNIKATGDHAEFAKDGRSKNQVAGSTGLVVIKESAEWILLFGTDSQWSHDKISFGSMIQDSAEKDFKRFKERIMMDLTIGASNIR